MAKPIDFALQTAPPKPRMQEDTGVSNFATVRHAHPCKDEECLPEVAELICCGVGAKATIAEQLTELVNRPNGVPVLRNLLALVEILGKLKFEALTIFSRELDSIDMDQISKEPPSLWQLFKSAGHPDVRRGLGLLIRTTEALGRATR